MENQIQTQEQQRAEHKAKCFTPRASWNYSLDQIRRDTEIYTDEEKQLLAECFLFCIQEEIPFRDFCEKIHYDYTTVGRIYRGAYLNPTTGKPYGIPANMLKGMREFLDTERKRVLLGTTEFVETPTAKRIFTACDLARESGTPVFLWGASHIGKTFALTQYSRTHNHGRSPYIRIRPARGINGFLETLAIAVGISPHDKRDAIIARIKKAVKSNMLMILDELHQLSLTSSKYTYFQALEILREIYDETGCGMVLCGTELFETSVMQERNGVLEQLYRRGVHKIKLPSQPTRGDVAAVLKANGLEFPDRDMTVQVKRVSEQPYEILRVLARDDGLKSITERIRYARKLGKGVVSWQSFVAAHLYIAAQRMTAKSDWE